MEGYKLDKSHVFKVTMFDDFAKYAGVTEEYVPPPLKEYQPMVSEGEPAHGA